MLVALAICQKTWPKDDCSVIVGSTMQGRNKYIVGRLQSHNRNSETKLREPLVTIDSGTLQIKQAEKIIIRTHQL